MDWEKNILNKENVWNIDRNEWNQYLLIFYCYEWQTKDSRLFLTWDSLGDERCRLDDRRTSSQIPSKLQLCVEPIFRRVLSWRSTHVQQVLSDNLMQRWSGYLRKMVLRSINVKRRFSIKRCPRSTIRSSSMSDGHPLSSLSWTKHAYTSDAPSAYSWCSAYRPVRAEDKFELVLCFVYSRTLSLTESRMRGRTSKNFHFGPLLQRY